MAQSTEIGNREQQIQQELRDAGSCLAMGAGVGTVGTASALLLGATLPDLCCNGASADRHGAC